MSDTTSKSAVAKPDPFDGKTENYRGFKRQFLLYITANKKQFEDDEQKILFVLSYMKTGLAAQWANNIVDEVAEEEEGNFGTAKDFFRKLELAFGNPNEKKDAQRKLSEYKQGSRTAEEFFQTFEQLRRQAGYEKDHDQYLIELLELNLRRELVQAVYNGESLPEDYGGWREKATRIDGLQRRFQNLKGSPPVARQFVPRQTGGMGSSSTGTREAMTFGGRGQPMEVDRSKQGSWCAKCGLRNHTTENCRGGFRGSCQKCGKQGHTTLVCPGTGSSAFNTGAQRNGQPKTTIRELFNSLSKEEKEEWLAETLKGIDRA